MAGIPVTQTEANLLRAFICAAVASRRYRVTAAFAAAEGRGQAAAVLRCLAQRRAEQAEGHLRMLDRLEDGRPACSALDVGFIVPAAIAEAGERSAAYAGMARTAREEGFDEIADWFELVAKGGRSRVRRLRRVLDNLTERGDVGFGR